MTAAQGPIIIDVDDDADAPDPATAPMILDAPPAPRNAALATVARVAARPVSWLARIFWATVSSLLILWVSTTTWDFVFALFDRNIWLGRTALVAGGLLCAVVAIFVLKEFASLHRLRRLDALRNQVQQVKASGNPQQANRISDRITTFYAARPDLAWAMADLAKTDDQVIDATERLELVEKTLMAPIDAQATDRISSAARQVATATAIVPLPLADVLVALTANLRMVRQIAETYGGRSGSFGSWRLLRAVAVHLVATGAIGVADDMVGSVIGGSAMARLSRRFGEGIINGALTVRVGIAAMELSRPMPFDALPRPGVTALVRRSLTGMFAKPAKQDDSGT